MKSLYRIAGLALALTTAESALAAGEQELTLDWIFEQEGRRAMSMPSHRWVDSGVLIYDRRPAESERKLQLLVPGSGEIRDVLDTPAVLASMNETLAPEEPMKEIGWPTAVTSDGKLAAFQKQGNIILLDLESGDFEAVAGLETKERVPRFSPDGQWVAYLRGNDIYAWHIADKKETRLTTGGTDVLRNGRLPWVYWEELMGRTERGFMWSPDSSAIAYLQSDSARVAEAAFVDIQPVELPRLITQRYPQPGTANPMVRAGIVPINNPVTTWVDLGAYPYEYLPRIQWLPDSSELAVQTMNRAQTIIDVFIADAETGAARHVLREQDDAWIDVNDDLHFFADGSGFLWSSARSGSLQLYRYNMDGELVNRVTDGEPMRASGSSGGQDRALSYVDEAAGLVFFTGLGEDSTERHLYRVALDGSGLKKLSTTSGTHAIRFSPQGGYFLDSNSAVDRLPALELKDREGTARMTVAQADASIPETMGLDNWEMFEIAAEDGVELPAMLLKPRDFDPDKRYPVLMYVYGGPSAPTVNNRWGGGTRNLYHQMLANRGVAVFMVDNRSSAARSHAETAQIVKQYYGPIERKDMTDAVTWIKSQPWVDGDRVGIWGWSGGGTNTLSAMTGSEEFSAGVAVAPLTDPAFYDTIYAERYMKRPQDNPEGYAEVSLPPKAKNLHGRLLIVHGTYDDNVHPQSTWAFTDELIEANILFDQLIYPMRKHGISDDAAQKHLYGSMLDFWGREFDLNR